MTGVSAPFSPADTVQIARPAPRLDRSADPAAARKSAREFEAFFIGQMLEEMFRSVPTDGFFGGGHAEGVYRSMLIQQYGRAIADRGGIGIADMVSREMLSTQEVKQ